MKEMDVFVSIYGRYECFGNRNTATKQFVSCNDNLLAIYMKDSTFHVYALYKFSFMLRPVYTQIVLELKYEIMKDKILLKWLYTGLTQYTGPNLDRPTTLNYSKILTQTRNVRWPWSPLAASLSLSLLGAWYTDYT